MPSGPGRMYAWGNGVKKLFSRQGADGEVLSFSYDFAKGENCTSGCTVPQLTRFGSLLNDSAMHSSNVQLAALQ